MGIFDIFADDENPADIGDVARGLASPPAAAASAIRRGPMSGLFGRGSSGASAADDSGDTSYVPSDEENNQRWRQGLIDDANRKAEESRIRREAGLYDPVDAMRTKDAAEATHAAAQVEYLRVQADKMRDEMARQNSPEARKLLETQYLTAQASLKNAEAQYQKIISEMPAEQQIRLRDELDTKREYLRQEFESAKSDREFDRIMQREDLAFQRQMSRDDRQFGRDLMRDQMSLGVQVRGQELQRLKAQDDFVMNMLQNQIAAGRLSLDKASKQFEAYVTKARLPSEIMANVGRAVEPLLPYMTSMKAGDIPMGFEKGGSRDIIGRLGGNAAGSYDPGKYAARPVEVNPFDLAKKAGADFSQTKVPNPGGVFGGVNVPSVPSGGTSATAGIGPISQYSGQVAGMQQGLMAGGGSPMANNATPMPPNIGPSQDESQQLMKALGG